MVQPDDHGGDRVEPDELRASSAPEAASAPDTVDAASPFPPEFRWEASPSEAPTQVFGAIDANTAGSDASATTHASRSSPAYQQRPSHVEDLFQPVDRPVDRPGDRPTDSSAPPWAKSDLPPIAEQQDAWMRRNPEAFKPVA